MATETTISRPAPFVEDIGTQAIKILKIPVDDKEKRNRETNTQRTRRR